MRFEKALALLIIVGLVFIAGCWIATDYFSEEAVQERRRRRSNRRLASKAKRPMVKFSVRTKKKK